MRFDADTAYNELHPHFQGRVRLNEPLARHCTFGVGGPADVPDLDDWLVFLQPEELLFLVSWPPDPHRLGDPHLGVAEFSEPF